MTFNCFVFVFWGTENIEPEGNKERGIDRERERGWGWESKRW